MTVNEAQSPPLAALCETPLLLLWTFLDAVLYCVVSCPLIVEAAERSAVGEGDMQADRRGNQNVKLQPLPVNDSGTPMRSRLAT